MRNGFSILYYVILKTGRFCLDEILLKHILVQSSGAFGVGQRQRAGNALSHSVFVNGDQR